MVSENTMIALAKKYLPTLHFHEDEKFVPINVEYWLSHILLPTSDHNFNIKNEASGSLIRSFDIGKRDYWNETREVIPKGKISLSPSDSINYIGKDSLAAEDPHYISFSGSLDYNFSLLSTDGAYRKFFDPLLEKRNNQPSKTPPHTNVEIPPRPIAKHSSLGVKAKIELRRFEVYAEIIPASNLVPKELDISIKKKLEPFLAINYYYFYPVMMDDIVQRSSPEGFYTPSKWHEGQWECITLLFRPNSMDSWDEKLRPLCCAYSLSWEVGNNFYLEARAGAMQWQEEQSPSFLVALGTHENRLAQGTDGFAPRSKVGGGWEPPSEKTVSDIFGAGLLFMNLGATIALFGVAAFVGSAAILSIPAIAFVIVGICLILFGFLIMIISEILRSKLPPPIPKNKSKHPERMHRLVDTSYNGIQVGGKQKEKDTSYTKYGDKTFEAWSLRVINMLDSQHLPPQAYPPLPMRTERPAWWGYAGMW